MTNKTLARILYLTLISLMIVTTILALIYGGNIADFYALLSGISILLTLIPLWLANRVFQNSTFSDVLDQKKLLWG